MLFYRMDLIKGSPTPGLTYNPNLPLYWDRNALAGELARVYEICHGCRLCFNLCPSFPALFQAVDRHQDGVRALSAAEHDRILDTCYQCKLCYVKCPYTPDDRHPFQLDFPRLLTRAAAIRRRARGAGLRELMLARPELVGRLGKAAAGFANWAGRRPLLRRGMELLLGIHREKCLPDFHAETFEDWFRKQPAPAGDPSKAVLFTTCFVNYHNPQVAKDAVDVFSRCGVALSCPRQNCCGMPALESGDLDLAKTRARSNIESLLPHAQAGKKILAVNPSCSYMMRKEYPGLDGSQAARTVAAAVMDLCEYLFLLKQQNSFSRDFRSTPGRIAYHLPCHLKAQNIGFRSRDLMRLIPGTSVQLIDHCCGHDGTWAMKKEFFPLSLLAGRRAFDAVKEAEPEWTATDCPLAALQFEQALGRRPIHPIQVLARAYRSDGFPRPVPPSRDLHADQ